MDEAESFLMKSRVQSIWPHARASWCVGFVERVGRAKRRSVWLCRPMTFSGCVAGAAVLVLSLRQWFALGSRAHSGARSVEAARFMSVLVLASSSCSGVFQFPHCACGLVGRTIGRSRLRRPHAGGGRVNCAAWVSSRLVAGCRRFQVASLILAI